MAAVCRVPSSWSLWYLARNSRLRKNLNYNGKIFKKIQSIYRFMLPRHCMNWCLVTGPPPGRWYQSCSSSTSEIVAFLLPL